MSLVPRVEHLGEGRIWAIHTAQILPEVYSLEDGLAVCTDFSEAADVFRGHNSRDREMSFNAGRFAERTAEVIDGWIESDGEVLPGPHPDLSVDLSSRRIGSMLVSDYRYDANTPKAALTKLRALRLVLPEILRRHRPAVEVAKAAGLIAVRNNIMAVERPVSRVPKKRMWGFF